MALELVVPLDRTMPDLEPLPERDAAIVVNLRLVRACRTRASLDTALSASTLRVKRYQSARFERTHHDLLMDPLTRDAGRFFLDDLYGPKDFTQRDDQFERIVPAMSRLFPASIVETVRSLSELHALSEVLDQRMAAVLSGVTTIARRSYHQSWLTVGLPEERDRQAMLVLQVGQALTRHTRSPLTRATLKAMRGPAAAAGLHDLQAFLESGFRAFAALPDAQAFLKTVVERERALMSRLFETTPTSQSSDGDHGLLGQLP